MASVTIGVILKFTRTRDVRPGTLNLSRKHRLVADFRRKDRPIRIGTNIF